VYNYTAPLGKFSTIFSTTILSTKKGDAGGGFIHRITSHLLNCGKGLDKRGKLATIEQSKQGRATGRNIGQYGILVATKIVKSKTLIKEE